MSIKVMNLVWSYAPPEVTQGKLLILLALADYSDDEGGSIFPTMRTLGKKARLNESQARRIVADLIERGLLERMRRGGWDGERNRSSEYRIIVSRLEDERERVEGGRKNTPPRKMRPPLGANGAQEWAQNEPTVGAPKTPATPARAADPSSDPSLESSSRSDDDDADAQLRTALNDVGVKLTPATLRHYSDQIAAHGLAAVLAGLERAAAHGKAHVRSYVAKCTTTAATGAEDSDTERRHRYIPSHMR